MRGEAPSNAQRERMPPKERASPGGIKTMKPSPAQQEIREAIQHASRKPSRIRALSTLSLFRYVYTCHQCGSHTSTHLHASAGWAPDAIQTCGVCGGASNDHWGWQQELRARARKRAQGQLEAHEYIND